MRNTTLLARGLLLGAALFTPCVAQSQDERLETCLTPEKKVELLASGKVSEINKHPTGSIDVWFRLPNGTHFIVAMAAGASERERVRFVLNKRFGEALAVPQASCSLLSHRDPSPKEQARTGYVSETRMSDLEAAALYDAFVRARMLPDTRKNFGAKDLVELLTSANKPPSSR